MMPSLPCDLDRPDGNVSRHAVLLLTACLSLLAGLWACAASSPEPRRPSGTGGGAGDDAGGAGPGATGGVGGSGSTTAGTGGVVPDAAVMAPGPDAAPSGGVTGTDGGG